MWKTLNIYDRLMFAILLILVVSSSLSMTGVAGTAIGLGILLMIVQGVKEGRFPAIDRGIGLVLLAHTLLWAVSCAFSLDPERSFHSLGSLTFRFVPLFFAMLYLREKWQLRWIWILFALTIIVDDGRAIWQYFTSTEPGWAYRPKGFNRSPTFLASHMLMAVPVLVFAAGREYMGKMERRLLLFAAGMAFVGLILSGTRGGWLAFLGTAALYGFLDRRYRKRAIMVLSAFLLALCLAVASSPVFQARMVTLTDPSFQSNNERILMWQSAAHIIQDNPLVGVGMDEFGQVYNTKYISPLAKERPKDPTDPETGHGHPHNNILKMFSEGGIFGLSAFLILYGYFFWRFFRLWRKEGHPFPYGLMMILVLAGLQMEGMTDTNLNQVSILREYWLLTGIVMAAGQLEQREKGDTGTNDEIQ